jgi:hypothetical protein
MYVFEGIFLARSEEIALSRAPTSFTGDLLGPWLVTMNWELGGLFTTGNPDLESLALTLRIDGLRLCVLLMCACDEDLLGTLDWGMA